MLSRVLVPAATLLLGATSVVAQDSIPTCSLTKKCPEEAPCCSQYGQCGIGAYCLGGCDPRMSFSLDACAPVPVCESRTFPMTSNDRILDVSEYLGDPSQADFVSQGETIVHDGNVLLTMPPRSVGTVIASTVNIWYGKVKARMRTSRGAGVVTAFILMSDVKDEIDYEFVGTQLETAQTNYYWQGVTDYTKSQNISLSDTFSTFHDYEIDWTPDEITWLVDGQVGRTVKRSDTWDEENQRFNYPQTPSRLQMSIWPGGAASNAKGTIDWAGGEIDWTGTPDMKSPGYYYATFGEVSIECYGADKAPGTSNGKSYTFNDIAALEDNVVDGDKDTILASFQATGLDMDKGKKEETDDSKDDEDDDKDDDSDSDDDKDTVVATIPGGSSTGPGSTGSSTAQGNTQDSGDGTDDDSAAAEDDPKCGVDGFSQNCNDSSNTDSAAPAVGEKVKGASAMAGIVALGALLVL